MALNSVMPEKPEDFGFPIGALLNDTNYLTNVSLSSPLWYAELPLETKKMSR